jgi:hypothetical protein
MAESSLILNYDMSINDDNNPGKLINCSTTYNNFNSYNKKIRGYKSPSDDILNEFRSMNNLYFKSYSASYI